MSHRGAVFVVAALAALMYNARPAIADDAPTDSAAASEYLAEETPDYDPWKPFNERTFWFNYYVLDKKVLKPLASGWARIVPYPLRHAIANFFDNLSAPKRFVNDLFQVRPHAAAGQFARFVLNTTAGAAGFMDVADRLGVHGTDADGGQTLGVWGFGQGPYLVLPLMPPLTLRDGIGYGADSTMDPIGYVAPVPFTVSIATTAVRRVNDRSLLPAAYENVEETVLDLYSAVRNLYLQRRRRFVGHGRADSVFFRRYLNVSMRPTSRATAAPPPAPASP